MILLDVGYKNFIDSEKITAIISPNTSRSKWIRKEAIESHTLVDCTQGRKTNSMIILSTSHIVLSSLKYKSLLKRLDSYGIDTDSIEVDFTGNHIEEEEYV